jgi:flagellar biogenesis protein FliO
MSIWVKIGILLIVLHLIAGFGWLVYKLSPRKKKDRD